jgi:hypothetical protein
MKGLLDAGPRSAASSPLITILVVSLLRLDGHPIVDIIVIPGP